MKTTVSFTDLIASSSSRRIELERRIQRLAFELRDELADLTGTEYRVQMDADERFIFIVERLRPSNAEVTQ